MARMTNFAIYPSQTKPEYRRKLGGRRVYILVENRSPTSIYMNYDNMPAPGGVEGIEIVAGAKYELWDRFAPDNDVIWFIGSNGGTPQQLNITDGYEH